MIYVIFLVLSCFFALNMGASSFAASMATACGSGAITRRKAQYMYIFLIVSGAVLFGQEVSKTLSKGIVPAEIVGHKEVVIILLTASLSLLTANMMHIPQSTSLSTIAAICGVGLYYQQVFTAKIYYLAICWALSILISFVIIYGLTQYIYPPRSRNFWVYERIVNHKERLSLFIVLTSAYNAFAQGSNNVANVVGPLNTIGVIGVVPGLFLLGIIFGLGAFTFKGPLITTSERIVPLGLLTATIINFITATITILASILGIPQPAVIIYTMAIFAIGSIKDGALLTVRKPIAVKTFVTWSINPLLTLLLSFALSRIFLPN